MKPVQGWIRVTIPSLDGLGGWICPLERVSTPCSGGFTGREGTKRPRTGLCGASYGVITDPERGGNTLYRAL